MHVPHGSLRVALFESFVEQILRLFGLLFLFGESLPEHAVRHIGRGELHGIDLDPREFVHLARTRLALQLCHHVSHGRCLARARYATHICAR
jgi:hypothetical protein